MPTLLQIEADMQALDDLLTDSETDISEQLEPYWVALESQLENKAQGYAALIREMELRATARMAERDRLERRIVTDRNNARFLKERLKLVMEKCGLLKIETEHFRLSVARDGGKPALQIDGEADAIAAGYGLTPAPVAHKQMIRDAIDQGENLPFARLLPRGTHLNIR